ncbi:MAG: ABC transporter substrate-binding protein [Oscillospiraceae bacterium]|jgi:NitT/TauT family transport system substrate-binding protein|nr:ABC transporter substrate-binding protein [Oscillospiraceae bacterium]
MKKRLNAVIPLLLVTSLILTACSKEETKETTATTVATTAATTAAGETTVATTGATTDYKYGKIKLVGKEGALCGIPLYVAYTKGFFAEEGFDVELISADTETRKTYLNNGDIPVVNGDFQFFPSIENGVNVKVIDGLHNGCIKFLVPKDSNITDIAQIKELSAAGKLRIGVDEIGGTPHQVASVWLEKNGISALPADNKVTFLPFSDGNLQVTALENKEIDVAALWDPFGSVQEKTGDYRVIFDLATDPIFAGKYCCFLYGSNKWIEEKPEQLAALLRAYHKSQDWIANNPDESVKIVIDGKFSSIEDTELAVELIKHYELPKEHEHTTRDVGEDVKYFAQELYSIGYLQGDPAEFAKNNYVKIDLTLGQ